MSNYTSKKVYYILIIAMLILLIVHIIDMLIFDIPAVGGNIFGMFICIVVIAINVINLVIIDKHADQCQRMLIENIIEFAKGSEGEENENNK